MDESFNINIIGVICQTVLGSATKVSALEDNPRAYTSP